jgi:glycine dehydrogenase subunit 2
MTMNATGRSTRPEGSASMSDYIHPTLTGGRGLLQDEALIFELGGWDKTGVDLPDADPDVADDLGDLVRAGPIGLPGLSEPECVRHYVRLSQKNHAIDLALYPLGSCTMKHNPRLNEKMARLAGFSDIHPLQPQSSVQGALELMDSLAHWLKTLTGMPAVALSPKAGAHGELCGLLSIRAAHRAAGHGLQSEHPRNTVLAPTSAHGTNPATAAFCGYRVEEIAQTSDGRVDIEDLKRKLGPHVAAIMVTNPNTCGLFERDIIEIARLTHEAGAYFYADGANFNAIVGRVRPGDLGVDAMHINLHKTFSTPHGGGGPGAGPVVLSAALAPFAPLPWIVHGEDGFELVEHEEQAEGRERRSPFGRMCAFHGQMGMFVRAYAYMLSHGADGLRQVAEDAVLNANYLKARLSAEMSAAFPQGPCMHEALFDDAWLEGTGVTTLDFAKAMIDEGFHPMTMYFPLVVHGAMLIEPTETESKAELDRFADALLALARAAKAGDVERFRGAPYHAPLKRLDETLAARRPRLRWTPAEPQTMAAE